MKLIRVSRVSFYFVFPLWCEEDLIDSDLTIDHNLLLYPYKTSLDESETIDNILSGRKDFMQALEAKDPQLGWNSIGKPYLIHFNPLPLAI